MPSQYPCVASSSSAPLSEIIKLEPEKEPWCAGYAPSQGRRCHSRTNARGRSLAMMLLNQGTKDLRAGRSIDTLLEDLAHHVLCTRFHQSQALDLTRRWKRQVRTYLDSQVVSPPSPRPARRSSQIVYSRTAEVETEDRIRLLYQRLREATEEVRRFEIAEYGRSITASPPTYREGRGTSAVVNSYNVRNTSSRNNASEYISNQTVRGPSIRSTSQSATPISRPAQRQVNRQTSASSAQNSRLETPPNALRTGIQHSRGQALQVKRRTADGECGICLCDLRISQQAEDDHEESEHSSDDEDNEDDYDDDDDDDDDDYEENNGHQDQELTWCKARCGVNFHKQCIDRWLATARAPTCPACRSHWRH